jgi:hypothetical protein
MSTAPRSTSADELWYPAVAVTLIAVPVALAAAVVHLLRRR